MKKQKYAPVKKIIEMDIAMGKVDEEGNVVVPTYFGGMWAQLMGLIYLIPASFRQRFQPLIP